jgi:hypothetical protein
MRARDYDPVTGRFVSRDPVEPAETAPETYNPYVFANSNPQVYTDPTGGFSVTEISITGAVQNITNNWQTIAVTAARRYLTGKVREAVTDALLQGFTKVLPKGKLTAAVFRGSVDVMEQGKIFGAKVRELFCGALTTMSKARRGMGMPSMLSPDSSWAVYDQKVEAIIKTVRAS